MAVRCSILLGVCLLWNPAGLSAQDLWFSTGQPNFVEPTDPARGAVPLLSHDEYHKLARQARDFPAFVALERLPSQLSPEARFGINLMIGSKNCGWVVDRPAGNAYVVYADTDADGDLSDAPPIELKAQRGYFTGIIEATVTDHSTGEAVTFVTGPRVVIVPRPDGVLTHIIHSRFARTGTARIGERSYSFRLVGFNGRYGEPTDIVWFDLNQDGDGYSDLNSPELFRVRDRFLRVSQRSFEFHVDPFGRSLRLTPADGAPVERASLETGGGAPDFEAVDIDSHSLSLSRYRDRVLVLDFWATWCGPCRAEASDLLALVSTYTSSGLSIIGVTPDDEAAIRAFAAEQGHNWAQIRESIDGPLHRLFRVVGYPAKVVIGRDGRLAHLQTGGDFATFEHAVKSALASRR